jgi:hypothetical protein
MKHHKGPVWKASSAKVYRRSKGDMKDVQSSIYELCSRNIQAFVGKGAKEVMDIYVTSWITRKAG